ncbi:MAG TPA: exo-alpha-sialidase [Sedimentisphaerales bacterium]|nr:exo-alpha-sialidase [Sedimentisphaerales bacterium]
MNAASMCSPHLRHFIRITGLAAALFLLVAGQGIAQPEIQVVLPERTHPYLACTAEELTRVRQAYRAQGQERDIVAAFAKEAERFIDEPISFPPRGGQHNQWYQCDKCEIALKTIDATRHQCPKCGQVYSGPPYDDVMFSREHSRNLRQMRTAAWAYAISDEKRFADYAAKVLLGYAERYEQYPYHSNSNPQNPRNRSGGHIFEQTLNEAVCLSTEIGPAYDLIHDSGVLSAADHTRIREKLLLPMLRNLDKNRAGKNNWQTWHNAGMIWGGALLRDPAWVQRAVTDPQNGFFYQMRVSVSKEGMWYENSWGYHFYTLQALINIAETARRLDIDLWSDERLKAMFTLPIHSDWYKATISHNAVLLDGKSQQPATGKLLHFKENDNYTAVVASCDEAYPGVRHTRWLVMTDAYLAVLDELRCDAKRQFDWLYHNRGRKAVCEAAQNQVPLAGKFQGSEYIQNAAQGVTADTIRIRFEDEKVPVHLTMAAEPNTTVKVADGVGGSITDRVPMAMIGRTGRDVRFAAVLEPIAADGKPQITGVRLVQAGSTPKVLVERGNTTDTIEIREDRSVSVSQAIPLKVETLLTIEPGPGNPRNSEGDIIELKDGRLCLIYTRFTGGSGDEAEADLAMRVFADRGRTWSEDTILVPRTGGMNVMSVSLLRLASGEIAFFYLRKTSNEDCRPMMRLSTDEGKTWSEPECCITDEVGYYVLNNDRVVQLQSGRLVLPVAWHQGPGKPRDWAAIVMCYLSDDNGKTWRPSRDSFKGYGPDGQRVTLQEPGVVELKDGSLMMFIRTDAGSQYICHSSDGGETWSRPGPSDLASPLSPASIERIPWTGELMCVWNDHSGAHPYFKGRRTPLCLAVSKDEGKTWSPSRVLEDNPDGRYCYTAIAFVDNRILLAYCAGDRQIGGLNRLKVAVLSQDCLTNASESDTTR